MAAPAAPILLLISVDPRHSHRAFEALRISVGIVAGENPVTVVLVDGAAHLLDEDTDDLVDGDDILKFRDTLKRLGVPFHVAAEAIPSAPDWNAGGHSVVPVDRTAIADLIARARRVLIF